MAVHWGDRGRDRETWHWTDEQATGAEEGSGVGKPCFYCCKEVCYPIIAWGGPEASIFLHAECAVLLASHLLSDWRAVEGGYQEYRRRRKWHAEAQKLMVDSKDARHGPK